MASFIIWLYLLKTTITRCDVLVRTCRQIPSICLVMRYFPSATAGPMRHVKTLILSHCIMEVIYKTQKWFTAALCHLYRQYYPTRSNLSLCLGQYRLIAWLESCIEWSINAYSNCQWVITKGCPVLESCNVSEIHVFRNVLTLIKSIAFWGTLRTQTKFWTSPTFKIFFFRKHVFGTCYYNQPKSCPAKNCKKRINTHPKGCVAVLTELGFFMFNTQGDVHILGNFCPDLNGI